MRVLGPSEVVAALDLPALVEALRQMFRGGDVVAPQRQRHAIEVPGAREGSLLVMPVWQTGRHLGIKLLTVFPDNAARNDPSIMGEYLLLDARTGKPLALLDGPALTARRTAAASALAASYLARPDCERLLMIGTGRLAAHLIEAHASVRPIRNVLVWGRHHDKAVRLAQRLTRRTLKVAATDDLQRAANGAHVICCATLATEPILRGHWLPLGVHVDLVGGFTPQMREADDETMRRARVFVDTREGALAEAGDVIGAIQAGVMTADDIAGDLYELTRGSRAGRRFHDQITVFKSVGAALEDLAAAKLALDTVVN
ncbi:MAG TPA: ornithine cyclodeaminase family protein [Stellaceae bacterium]|nr:ornithine cyclodeaminase family protein [Stellaceae bacterium]